MEELMSIIRAYIEENAKLCESIDDDKTKRKHEQLVLCFDILFNTLEGINFNVDRICEVKAADFFNSQSRIIQENVNQPLLTLFFTSGCPADKQLAQEILHYLKIKAGLILDLDV